MPSKPDKSQDQHTGAGKSPSSESKAQDAKRAEREARLAEALRANLRRRKQGAGDKKKKDDLNG